MIRDDPTIRRWLRILIKAVNKHLKQDKEYITVYTDASNLIANVDSRSYNMMDMHVNRVSNITVYDALRELYHLTTDFTDGPIHIHIGRGWYEVNGPRTGTEIGRLEDLQ